MLRSIRIRRFACVLLASLLLIQCPIRARASALALTVTAGSYTITQVLGALGVLAGGATVGVLIGSFADEATYLAKGAARELGTFAQYVYDNARSGVSELESKFVEVEQALIGVMTSAWGSVVSGVKVLAGSLYEFLRSLADWGKAEEWSVPVGDSPQQWGVSTWTTLDRYGIEVGWSMTGAQYLKAPYAFLFTAMVPVSSSYMQVQEYFYDTTLDVFAYYDLAVRQLRFYYRYADVNENWHYTAYRMPYNWGNVDQSGKAQANNYGYSSSSATVTCSPEVVGGLPIPVFSNMAALEHYAYTGEITDAQTIPGSLSLDVEKFRDDVAALPYTSISDTFTLPDTADDAAVNIGALTDAFASGTVQDITDAITSGGLVIDVGITDVPSVPDEDDKDASMSDLLDGLAAIPGAIIDALTDFFSKETEKEESESKLSVPAVLAQKFPFCIPFDLIYLVDALAAEPQAPRIEIPIHIDYLFVRYDHVLVVDFAEWEAAAEILRIMLNLLFTACLIAGTRQLIKG